jgi:NAD(P)-dependent dehydrogenase (short-subunit alcohol dehydrogenase family)
LLEDPGGEIMGRIAIITGANRGIGKETAIGLAQHGITVILACRNVEQAQIACDEIRSSTGNNEIYVMKLDIASKESIFGFVNEFRNRFGWLNILVNNAGISSNKNEKTIDGYEINIGTNYFGTFALTLGLIPYFEKGADNRIIITTSEIYKFGAFNLGKLNKYRWVKAYAVSKYMLLLLMLELAGRIKDSGVIVNAVHPGVVRTSIMFTNKWYDEIIGFILRPFLIGMREGAKTGIWLSTSDDVRGQTGGYYYKCKKRAVSQKYNSIRRRKELWDFSMGFLG